VERQLANLSRQFPRLLIVPGTIAWNAPGDRKVVESCLRYYEGRAKFKPPLAGAELFNAPRAEWQIGSTNTLVNTYDRQQYRQANGTDMPTALLTEQDVAWIKANNDPLCQLMVNHVQNRDVLGKAAQAAIDRMADPAHRTHMMFNTAYAFLNGQLRAHRPVTPAGARRRLLRARLDPPRG
jgi:hypothetical protein